MNTFIDNKLFIKVVFLELETFEFLPKQRFQLKNTTLGQILPSGSNNTGNTKQAKRQLQASKRPKR